jgi:S1-C subfamily serine protease
VAKVVICPSCQYRGSIPDEVQAKRIRCPKCKESFDVAAATQSGAPPAKRPAPAKRPEAAVNTAFDDLDSVEPLPSVSTSGTRRAPAGPGRNAGSGQSPMVYAAVGVGGLAVVLLGVVLVVVLTRGGGEAPSRASAPSDLTQSDSPAPSTSRANVIQPVAATASDTSADSPASSTEDAPSAVSTASAAPDSEQIMRRLKDATVYLKHKIAGRTLSSGTGFVIEVRGDTVLLATNRHVAVFDVSEVPPSLVPKGSTLEFEAVFRSGQGPQKEQALPAEIIAADTSGEFQTDLAILVVRGVKKPPTPISVFAKSDTTEGMAYAAAGFPFGGMLNSASAEKNNPTVTTPFGHISRRILDKDGQLELFQVDGSLQPGNSGGPIVEEKTGKLIGLAVAKLGSVDTIGLVIPAEELRRLLAGRIGALDLTLKTLNQTSANLDIKAEIVDPKGLVKNVVVHAAPASAGTISPNADGSYPPLPNTKGVELRRDPKGPMASGQVQVTLSGQGAAARKILVQTAHRDLRGNMVYSKPKEIDLPEKPGRIAMSNENLKILRTFQRKSFSMLPPLVDPEKDCKLVKSEDDMKIKIEIPGGKVRTLAPYVVQRINKRKALHNAPMSLIDVEGDFAVLVEVTGEISAGATLPKDRQGNNIPFTFQAAGLLLYQDKDNFVRLERSAGVAVDTLQPIHKVLFEVVKDGKLVPNQNYPPVPDGPVYLLLVRRKGRVMCGASLNLGTPPQPFKLIELDLPKKIKVGLSASNISAKPFSAQFENFALISNETQLDAMFTEPEKGQTKE